eukprot:scaffold39436_cov40-Cyclotella_meneghiniana.AAC.3
MFTRDNANSHDIQVVVACGKDFIKSGGRARFSPIALNPLLYTQTNDAQLTWAGALHRSCRANRWSPVSGNQNSWLHFLANAGHDFSVSLDGAPKRFNVALTSLVGLKKKAGDGRRIAMWRHGLRLSLQAKGRDPNFRIGGFPLIQRFFLSWAQCWRQTTLEEHALQLLTINQLVYDECLFCFISVVQDEMRCNSLLSIFLNSTRHLSDDPLKCNAIVMLRSTRLRNSNNGLPKKNLRMAILIYWSSYPINYIGEQYPLLSNLRVQSGDNISATSSPMFD